MKLEKQHLKLSTSAHACKINFTESLSETHYNMEIPSILPVQKNTSPSHSLIAVEEYAAQRKVSGHNLIFSRKAEL